MSAAGVPGAAPAPGAGAGTREHKRIHAGDPRHFEIVEFLEDEAALLDDAEILAWTQLMADDAVYRVPVRVTRERDDGPGFSEHMFLMDESALTLRMKATRLAATPSAWAENPPSRTRRFVTNVRVHEADADGEVQVRSSILLVRGRYDDTRVDLVSARREDLLRRAGDSWKIARRTVYLDQSTLSTPNLAVFL